MTEPKATIEHLVVVRESDEYNLELMRGMILQTHHRYSDLPGHTQFLAAGEDPLLRPAAYQAVTERAGKTQSVLFEIEGTYCLYARGSAAKLDVDFENGFGLILSKAIRELRPKNIYLANFSRLVRRPEMSGGIKTAAMEARSTIHADGIPLDLTNPAGTSMFDILALVSSMDLQHILMRLTLGRLAKFRDNQWILGPRAVPLGYRLDPNTKRLRLDPDAEPIVHELLELIADPALSANDIVKRLGRKQLTTPLQSGDGWTYDTTAATHEPGQDTDATTQATPREGAAKTVANLASPAQFVNRILDLLDFYETGTYHFKWTSCLENVDRYSEFVVHPATDTQPAYIPLHYKLDLPPDGWGSPETFERIRAIRSKTAACYPRAAQARDTQLALLGNLAGWSDEHHEWQLLTAGNPPSYQLRRRPKQPVGTGKFGQRKTKGWIRGSVRDGDLVTTVHAADLHRSIFATTAQAISQGVPARRVQDAPEYRILLVQPHRGLTTQERARDLRDKARRARHQANQARNLLYDTTEAGAFRDRLREDAERLETTAQNAEAALAALESEDLQPTPIDSEGVTCEIDLLVQTMVALSKADGPTPRIVSTHVNRLFRNLRLQPTSLDVAWSVEVQVPIDNGDILVLGPITGTVPQRSTAARTNRAPAIAKELMTSERPVSDFGWSNSKDGQAERERARAFLANKLDIDPRAASKALVCAVPETRSALWSLIEPTHPYPRDVHPDFAAHVLEQLRIAGKGPVWYFDGGYRAAIINYLHARGGHAPQNEVDNHLRSLGASKDSLTAILGSAKPTVDIAPAPCPPNCPDGRIVHRTLSLKPCPHCGPGHWARTLLMVPECPAGAICPNCRRMPTPDSPPFPGGYLTLTADIAQARVDAAAPRSAVELRVKKRTTQRPGTSAHIRAWAQTNSIPVPPKGKLPAAARSAYYAAHPEHKPHSSRGNKSTRPNSDSAVAPHKPDPARIRQWAATQGIDVAAQGRLSERLTRDYLAAVFRDEVDPALVRQWARAKGLSIADSGPLPTDIVRSYLGLAGNHDIAAERQQRELAATIRKWARAREIPVPQRGRIPGYLISAYEEDQCS